MASGNARARATLRQAEGAYTPWALRGWPERALRKEYTRLRDIARKRLQRLGADPEGQAANLYRQFMGGFPTLKSMGNRRADIERAMADLALFVRSGTTVASVREENRRKAKTAGFSTGGFSPADWKSFGEWMEYAKASGILDVYDSDEIVQYYYQKGGRILSAADFERWRNEEDNYDEYTAEDDSGSDMFGDFD